MERGFGRHLYLDLVFCWHDTQYRLNLHFSKHWLCSSWFLLPALTERLPCRAMVPFSEGTMLLLLFGLADIPLARPTTPWNPTPHPLGKQEHTHQSLEPNRKFHYKSSHYCVFILLDFYIFLIPQGSRESSVSLIWLDVQLWCWREIRAAPQEREWPALL